MNFDAIARVVVSGAFAGIPSHSKVQPMTAVSAQVNVYMMDRIKSGGEESVEWIDRGVVPVVEGSETFVQGGGPD